MVDLNVCFIRAVNEIDKLAKKIPSAEMQSKSGGLWQAQLGLEETFGTIIFDASCRKVERRMSTMRQRPQASRPPSLRPARLLDEAEEAVGASGTTQCLPIAKRHWGCTG